VGETSVTRAASNNLIEAGEVFTMAGASQKKPSRSGSAAQPQADGSVPQIHEPQIRKKTSPSGRGDSVQTFLGPREKQAYLRFVRRLGLTSTEYLRWLITDAIVNRRVPPGFEEET